MPRLSLTNALENTKTNVTEFMQTRFVQSLFQKLILRLILVGALAGAATGLPLRAQNDGLLSDESNPLFDLQGGGSAISNFMNQGEFNFAIDNVVDPESYYVGPGDIMMLQLVGAMSGEYPLIVSPESAVLLPRIGNVSVRGLTLAEARNAITEVYKQRNANWGVSLTLVQARMIYVNIGGNVAFPRMYILPASIKASTAVKLANQLNSPSISTDIATERQARPTDAQLRKERSAGQGAQYVGSYASRFTMVFRKNGESVIADELRARINDDAPADPTLREGDEIFVPFEIVNAPTISIAGAVRRPTVLPFREGDRLSFLLKASYGLTESADSTAVYYFDGEAGRKQKIDVAAVLAGSGDLEVTPGGKIIVEEKSSAAAGISTVAVSGEVLRPGTYIVQPGVTRLREIIDQAGGFTEDAYLPLAYIQRRDLLAQAEEDRLSALRRMYQYSPLGLGDTARYNVHMLNRRPVVSCDFVAAFDSNSSRDNVPLQDGDVITVPGNPHNVFVFGHVMQPGYVEYVPGKTLSWYIERVGGPSVGAEIDRASLIKGRTRVWLEGEQQIVVESGDQIYVPREPEFPPGIEEQKYGLYVSIASSAVFLISTIVNFFR